MSEAKLLIDTSLQAILLGLQEHVQQGWEIDPEHPGSMWGVAYEIGLLRHDKSIAAMADIWTDGTPKVKLSRAESLAVARAALKEKREAQQ